MNILLWLLLLFCNCLRESRKIKLQYCVFDDNWSTYNLSKILQNIVRSIPTFVHSLFLILYSTLSTFKPLCYSSEFIVRWLIPSLSFQLPLYAFANNWNLPSSMNFSPIKHYANYFLFCNFSYCWVWRLDHCSAYWFQPLLFLSS